MTEICQLWDMIKEIGINTRRNNKNGQVIWNEIKTIIKEQKPSLDLRWRSGAIKFFKKMKKMGITGDDEYDDSTKSKYDNNRLNWERQHFLIQHGRIINNTIIANENPNLIRLMQIAFNAGQLFVEMNEKLDPFYKHKWVKFYYKMKMNCVLTYMNLKKLKKINIDITVINDKLKKYY